VKERINYRQIAPEVGVAIRQLDEVVKASGLDAQLVELLKVRVSQINGCAFCLDMHTQDARALGETEQRLYGLSAWVETPYYTRKERAALRWAEALTTLTDRVPDSVYDTVRTEFDEKDLMMLTLAVIAINSWNRLAISVRAVPGSYRRSVKSAVQQAQGQ
jgi:AhpD family alkylhydroperoxidase